MTRLTEEALAEAGVTKNHTLAVGSLALEMVAKRILYRPTNEAIHDPEGTWGTRLLLPTENSPLIVLDPSLGADGWELR